MTMSCLYLILNGLIDDFHKINSAWFDSALFCNLWGHSIPYACYCLLVLLEFELFSHLHICLNGIAIVGDITPSDGIPKMEKSRREREALDHMCNLLGEGSRGTSCTPTCIFSLSLSPSLYLSILVIRDWMLKLFFIS